MLYPGKSNRKEQVAILLVLCSFISPPLGLVLWFKSTLARRNPDLSATPPPLGRVPPPSTTTTTCSRTVDWRLSPVDSFHSGDPLGHAFNPFFGLG